MNHLRQMTSEDMKKVKLTVTFQKQFRDALTKYEEHEGAKLKSIQFQEFLECAGLLKFLDQFVKEGFGTVDDLAMMDEDVMTSIGLVGEDRTRFECALAK